MKYFLSLIVVILACLFLPSASAQADVFPITIRSVYFDPQTGRWDREVTWVFSRETEGSINVCPEGTERPVVRLEYGRDGSLKLVEKFVRRGDTRKLIVDRPASSIVLSGGFPVPYDELAAHDEGVVEVVIRKRAGGSVFSFKISKVTRKIGLDEAVARNMVGGEQVDNLKGKALKLVTVTKEGRFLVRQLWAEGALWWVYEETAVRKSWREMVTNDK